MPLQYIQTQLTAMCVLRWKGMSRGSNAGADKFTHDINTLQQQTRKQASGYGVWHPYRHIASICARVAALKHLATDNDTSVTDMTTTTRTLRPIDVTWSTYCMEWYKDKERSLVAHYQSHNIQRKKLPLYTTHDKSTVTAKRARLRFRRALFGFNNKRMGFTENTLHCDFDHCKAQEIEVIEDTKHVLLECPRHARDRDKLTQRMATLTAGAGIQPVPLSLPLLLDPPHHSALSVVMRKVCKYTGRFLLAVNRNKPY